MRRFASFGPFLIGLLLLGVALAPGARAEDETPEAPPGGAGKVVVNIGEEPVEVEAFLRVVARVTGIPMIWNPADKNIRGKKIIGSVDMSAPKDELFSQARALLSFYELVIIPVGPSGYQLNLVMDARQTSSILKMKPEHVNLTNENLARYEHQDGLFITTTIRVEHMEDLRSARNALTRIVTGQNIGNVTEVPHAKAFVVTDFAPNVVAIYRLLKEMDQPVPALSTTSGETVALALRHARAADLARTLNQHFAAPARGPRPPQAAGEEPSVPRITADPRTNQLLVTGHAAEIQAVKAAVAMLDTPVPAPEAKPPLSLPELAVEVVTVRHANAMRLANALGMLIGTSPALWSHSGARPSVVAADDALLIAAPAADLAKLKALIARMDVPAKE